MRPKLSTVIALLAVIVLTSVGTATAAGVINGKNIKKNSIPLSALNKKAIASLQGAQGPAGPAGAAGAPGAPAAKYWAYVASGGQVVRSSGGISAVLNTNGGSNPQYQVTFPGDISNCTWLGSVADQNPIGQSENFVPGSVGVGRSTVGPNTLAITVGWIDGGTIYKYQDNFSIAVFC